MNLKELKELIELVSEKGFAEFEIERQDFRLRICGVRTEQAAVQPAPPVIVTSPVPVDLASSLARNDKVPAQTPAPAGQGTAPAVEAKPAAVETQEAGLQTIKSPIVGTFYKAPSPTADPFVKVGDRVEPETVVCIIEAMKLMNEIQAEMSGEIVRILVENGQPVEYGQPLFALKK